MPHTAFAIRKGSRLAAAQVISPVEPTAYLESRSSVLWSRFPP
jgi:hypothetical protein